MCDTMVAVGDATADGVTLFAKNSDRSVDEPQFLQHLPRQQHAPGSRVRLTHVEIDQVPETAEVWLSMPFWMWGAEMGANEHGVIIGNEAVHGIVPASLEPGIIGMDLVRLGLERARTAAEALKVMTALLERHGQSGNCRFGFEGTYNNSFIIADAQEAWVLESLGRYWLAEQVQGARSISNVLSIGTRHERVAPGLMDFAAQRGLLDAAGALDFAAHFRPADQKRSGVVRFARTSELMAAQRGHATEQQLFAALRDHGVDANQSGRPPQRQELGQTVCVHPPPDAERPGHTAGSWVARLGGPLAVHWVTATATPCLSVFKPVFPDCGLPDQGPLPDEHGRTDSRWWWHQSVFCPTVMADDARRRAYVQERDALEQRFLAEVEAAIAAGPAHNQEARRALMLRCWQEADQLQRRWAQH